MSKLATMIAKKLKKSIVQKRSVWTVSNLNSDNESQLSCDEKYFAPNERIQIDDEQTNDLANIQLLILQYHGDP